MTYLPSMENLSEMELAFQLGQFNGLGDRLHMLSMLDQCGHHNCHDLDHQELIQLTIDCINIGSLVITKNDPNLPLLERFQPQSELVLHAWTQALSQQTETPQKQYKPESVNETRPTIDGVRWSENHKQLGMPVNLIFTARNYSSGDTAKIKIYSTPKNGEKKLIDTLEYVLNKSNEACNISWTVKSTSQRSDCLSNMPAENQAPLYFLFDIEINGHSSSLSSPLYTSSYLDVLVNGPYSLAVNINRNIFLFENNKQQKSSMLNDHQTAFTRLPLNNAQIEFPFEICKTALLDDQDKVISECTHPPQFRTPYLQLGSVKSHYKIKSQALFPPVIVNLREAAQHYDRNKRDFLSDVELEYFRKQGNNATIFIHGYNVPYGEPPKQIDNLQIKVNHKPGNARGDINESYEFKLDSGKHTRSTCIGQEELVNEYDSHFRDDAVFRELDDKKINGTGAHAWFLHMEHELNVAAGFDGKDWDKFTRIIGIAWSGDPNPINYMQAEVNADSAGIKLVGVIKQLLDEGIAVNIIAHSLGNRVALIALHELGSSPVYKEQVKNVFMWQPAIPDTALSPDPDKDTSVLQNWNRKYFNAVYGAEHFVVLYSNKDNILGAHTSIEDLIEDCFDGDDTRTDITECAVGVLTRGGLKIDGLYGAGSDGVKINTLLGQVKIKSGAPLENEDGKYFFNDEAWEEGWEELRKRGVVPRPAMGWGGPLIDNGDIGIKKLLKTKKIEPVNQTQWLFDHSGMKIPTKEIRKHIYNDIIWKNRLEKIGFGKY